MTVTVTGTEELSRLLKQAERSLTDKEIVKILKDSAGGMVGIARDDARRVNPGRKTYKLYRAGVHYTLKPGMLSRSIGVRAVRGGNPVVWIVPKRVTSYANDPWFAHFVHEGTASRTTRKGQNRGAVGDKTRPMPFMERAGSRTMRDYTAGLIIKKIKMRLTQSGL